jgi:hypothetical protein
MSYSHISNNLKLYVSYKQIIIAVATLRAAQLAPHLLLVEVNSLIPTTRGHQSCQILSY